MKKVTLNSQILPFHKIANFRGRCAKKGFSLIELLCVLAVISILATLAAPAFRTDSAGKVNSAAFAISAALQRARTYAMAHNTYVWVGFYEQAEDAPAPTNVFPYTGMGRVVVGMAASLDGTEGVTSTSGVITKLPPLAPIEKPFTLPDIHITALPAPAAAAPAGDTSPIDSRPGGAFNSGTLYYGINSDDATARAAIQVPIGQYTFYKVIRFSPSGEAYINDDTSLGRINEIGFKPTHGDNLDQNSPNIAAVQFTGIGGNVQVYRK